MQASLVALANIKLPIKVSYRISKILNQISGVMKRVNAEQRNLYQTMGVLNDDKSQWIIPDDRKADFDAAMLAIMDADAGITILPVSVHDLGDISIEAGHLALLAGFVLDDVPALTLVEGGDNDQSPTAA